MGDDDPGRATECHRLLARIAWEAADPSVVRANVDGLLRQLDCANARERVGVLDALAEVTMLAADDRAVAWAEQSLAAYEACGDAPTAALVNLGSALTDVPGRREEGRQLLARAVAATETTGDSFVRARALNNLLCEAVFFAPPETTAELLDKFEEVVFLGCLGAQLGEHVALYRAVAAERSGDAAGVRDALTWLGPAASSSNGCLAAMAVSFTADQGDSVTARAMLQATLEDDGGLGRSAAVWFAGVKARLDINAASADASTVLDQLFAPPVVATRYMLDHLDQVGRSCVVIARSAPTAAQEVLDRFAGWGGRRS